MVDSVLVFCEEVVFPEIEKTYKRYGKSDK